MAAEVWVEVVIDHGPHAGPGRITVLRLLWRPADPCAVVLRLTASPEHPALARGEWVLLREVLRDGLAGQSGEGLVRVHPDGLRDRVWLELDRSGPPACLSVPRDVVADFLSRTERVVPYGSEGTADAVEDLLRAVLPSG